MSCVSLVLRLFLKKNLNASRPSEHPPVVRGGVSNVLFYVCLFCFRIFASTEEAAALRSIILRSLICMRPDSHTQLPNNNCVRPFSFLFHPFFCFFGDVAFSDYFCTITLWSLYGEYVVRFFLPDDVFPPCDHAWARFFNIGLLREISIKQSIN